MLAFSLLTATLAAVASALPAAKRAPGPWCDGLGGGAFDTLANFTLAAYNATGTNANSTGAPLVLGPAGAITGAELKDLAVSGAVLIIFQYVSQTSMPPQTFASFPFNQYPSIALDQGRLIPSGPDTTPTAQNGVVAGSEVGFLASNSADPSHGAQIWCAVKNFSFSRV